MTLLACSGCFTGSGGALWAYWVATALMLSLPMVMVGTLAWWLRSV